jgi:hypothetical protein
MVGRAVLDEESDEIPLEGFARISKGCYPIYDDIHICILFDQGFCDENYARVQEPCQGHGFQAFSESIQLFYTFANLLESQSKRSMTTRILAIDRGSCKEGLLFFSRISKLRTQSNHLTQQEVIGSHCCRV